MKKNTNDRPEGVRRRGIAVILSVLLILGSLLGQVSALSVSAETEQKLEGQELTDSKALSALISDTWEEDYFASMVVDTDAGEVVIDGETEELQGTVSGEMAEEEILDNYIETLPDDTVYDVEKNDAGEYEITAPFQTKRLIVEAVDLQEDYHASEVYYNTEWGETILQFETEEETENALEALRAQYGEEKCYPDEIYYVEDILTDDVTVSGGSYSWGAAYMGMNTLKEQTEGKYGTVTVALLDTGIDASNFMFQSRNISGKSYNFIDGNKNVTDNHGHGTHVAGIIADATPSNVSFLILKISNSSGYSSMLTIKTALQYALKQNISAINMSLGFVASNASSCTYLDSLINKAYRRGIAVCAAAGNDGIDVSFCYPACNSKTVAVASFGKNEKAASYSNYGKKIDFSAPGTGIVSAEAGGFLVGMNGTSMSAPHITAAVAYLKMLQPNLSVKGVYNELRAHCKDLGQQGKDDSFGWGCPILTDLLTTGIIDKTNVVTADNTTVATPTIKSVKNTKKGIRLQWKKVKNADKYVIYRKKGKGSFKKIQTVSGKKKAWTDTNVVHGKKYTYAVKAVKNKKSSKKSTEAIVCLRQPQEIKGKWKDNGRVVIRWAEQTKISGYQIRYSQSNTMKKASVVDIAAGKTRKAFLGWKKKVYYFQVRALKKADGNLYYSAWSEIKRIDK